jgi:hypothetical protein
MSSQSELGLAKAPEKTASKEGRVVERNFDILSTHIPDFFLLVEHGTEPDLSRSQTRELRDTGIAYAARAI